MKITKQFGSFLKKMVLSRSEGPVEYLSDMFLGYVPYEKKTDTDKKDLVYQKTKRDPNGL